VGPRTSPTLLSAAQVQCASWQAQNQEVRTACLTIQSIVAAGKEVYRARGVGVGGMREG